MPLPEQRRHASALEPTADNWFVRDPRRSNQKFRLFCIPHAGGGAAAFSNWIQKGPADFDVWAVELPGRGRRMRETPHTEMAPLVSALVDAIRPHLDRPFAILGHSMGAWVAFEVARALEAEGKSPTLLVVAGIRAPQCPLPARPFHHMTDAEATAELKRIGGTPAALLQDADYLSRFILPVLRADHQIFETHRPGVAPIDIPILALGGVQDPHTTPSQLDAWRDQSSYSFESRWIPGDHFFIHARMADITEEFSARFPGK